MSEQGFGLPMELQSEVENLQRRRQLAQAMLMQAMQPRQQQMVGPVAVRQSPLVGILQGLGGAMGGYFDAQAARQGRELQQKAFQEGTAELGDIQKLPTVQERIGRAMVSRFPGIRGMGAQWQKDFNENRRAGAKTLGDVGMPGEALTMLDLDPGMVPPPKQPVLGQTPQGQTTVTNYSRAGVPTMNVVGGGININLPGKEKEMALERESKELTTRQEQARTAMADLAQTQRLVQLYERGLRTGGGEETFQAARQFFSAFGLDFPTGPLSSEAKTVFSERVANRIKEFGVTPTDADRKFVEQMVGTLNTSPEAVANLMAWTTAKALKGLQDFQDFVSVKRGAAGDNRAIYDTADVGIRMPPALFGPSNFQASVLQSLQQGGGDVTRFNDPVTNRPMEANTQFDIRGSAIPARKPATPSAQKPPNMPQRDWDRLQELEKRYRTGGR